MFVAVHRDSPVPLSLQIFTHLREMILRGGLGGGARLPSTRALARELGVSRNVVMLAYERLLAEGYVETRRGSGTRVAGGIRPPAEERGALRSERPAGSSRKAEEAVDFRSGLPAVESFPFKEWGRILRDVCLSAPAADMSYGAPEGAWELRRAISDYLRRTRGVDCHPERIVIVAGATQGLALAARLLYTPGAAAVVEDPLNAGMKKIISAAGYTLRPLPVDGRGLRTDLLGTAAGAALIYVTPSHQFPLGGILPAPRRSELLARAAEDGSYIVEDDYDSEFRHEGPPLGTLQSMAPERVIYLGSFSKILAPALRLGYAILPGKLVARARILKLLADVHAPTLDQLALARFIDAGRLERHAARMKRVYAARREVLLEALAAHFPGEYALEGAAAGLHLVAGFPGRDFTEGEVARIAGYGVRVYPVERLAIRRGLHRHRLILGYGHLTPEQIAEGIRRLKAALTR